MLELVVKGLCLWIYDLIVSCVSFVADTLLDVFSMDTAYFTAHAPVVTEMQHILLAVGWALLLGNLAFQALRGMVSGIGVDAEDPKLLFCKSALFSFLLVVSPQICQLGLDLTSTVIELLQVPDTVSFVLPEEGWFDFSSGWLLAAICGLILMFQVIRLFFEIGERYVVLCALTFFAPLAFAMGGSKSTEDIFKGWLRMFASMCVVSVSNVFFIKVILAALSIVPDVLTFVPWLIFVSGACKVARRVDDTVCRMGLNAAHTGREHILPGFFTAQVLRSMMQTAGHAARSTYVQFRTFPGGMGASGRMRATYPGFWTSGPQLRQATLPDEAAPPALPGPAAPSGGPSDGPSGPHSPDRSGGTPRPRRRSSSSPGGGRRSFSPAHGRVDIFPEAPSEAARTGRPQRPPRQSGGPSAEKSRPERRTAPQPQSRKQGDARENAPRATRPPIRRTDAAAAAASTPPQPVSAVREPARSRTPSAKSKPPQNRRAPQPPKAAQGGRTHGKPN